MLIDVDLVWHPPPWLDPVRKHEVGRSFHVHSSEFLPLSEWCDTSFDSRLFSLSKKSRSFIPLQTESTLSQLVTIAQTNLRCEESKKRNKSLYNRDGVVVWMLGIVREFSNVRVAAVEDQWRRSQFEIRTKTCLNREKTAYT